LTVYQGCGAAPQNDCPAVQAHREEVRLRYRPCRRDEWKVEPASQPGLNCRYRQELTLAVTAGRSWPVADIQA
jgi:hypothetical protein